MHEIALIKRKLADQRLKVSLQTLRSGIMTPVTNMSDNKFVLPSPNRLVFAGLPPKPKEKRKRRK
jgi:hypothetical protein